MKEREKNFSRAVRERSMASWPTFHRLRRPSRSSLADARSIVLFLLISPILATSHRQNDAGEVAELEQLKLQVARLETILEENTKDIESKSLHLEENSKLVQEMEHKIQNLQNALDDIKTSTGLPHSREMVNNLEQEVQMLWAESRKNNFDIHNLESKAYDAEGELESMVLEVEKMENIITEQWIQIRQLEQALQMTKMMASKVHKRSASKVHEKSKPFSCILLQLVKKLRYQPEVDGMPDSFFLGKPISSSFVSQAFDLFEGILSATRRYHHQVQGIVKQAMEMNEFTSALVNEEVIFFLASAVFTFPIMFIVYCWNENND